MKKYILIVMAFCAVSTVLLAKGAKEYVADLSSSDNTVVAEAVKWSGENKEKSAVPALLNLVKSSDSSDIRMNSAVSLGLIGEKSSSEPLSEDLLSEENSDVRYAIVLAITRIGIDSKKSYENLTQARDKETDPFIKDYIAKIEAKLKSK